MKTKIINGQNIYDIALQRYGSVDAVFALFSANESEFVNGFTTELPAGTGLSLPDWEPEKKTIPQSNAISLNLTQSHSISIKSIKPQIGMSLYDIAIAQYGSVNEVFELAKDNNKSITSIFSHLDKIQVADIKVSKPRARKYIKDKEIQPNSRVYPNRLKLSVCGLSVTDDVVSLCVDVLNEFPYSISTMLKFEFEERAADLDPNNQFTDAFDFGVDLPMPDAEFTYDTREISDLQPFATVRLNVQRNLNAERFVRIEGVPFENLNPAKRNNIFYDNSITLNY